MNIELQNKLKGKKVLFATFPADGHVNPLTGLAKTLDVAGCDVRWYSSDFYKNKIESLNIKFYSFVKAPVFNVATLDEEFPERGALKDPLAKLDFDLKHLFADMAPGALEDIKDINQEFDFDILIADSLFSAVPLVKKVLNKPVLSIGVIPLAEDSEHIAMNGSPLDSLNDEQRKAAVEEKAHFGNACSTSTESFSAILESYGIEHKKASLFDMLIKGADLYLQVGTPSFEYQRKDLGSNVRFIGALLPYRTQEKTVWSDERVKNYKKVILVTQGTVEGETTKLLEPTLEAFRGSETLIIATTAGHNTEALREKFADDNYIIEDFIPFEQVMPYASVYVTNGGYGGTMMAIQNGLPMVAGGIHEGKVEVCARIGFFEYGIDLRTETPESTIIKEAVSKVLSTPSYKENVLQLSKEIENYNAEELCGEYIINLLEKKYDKSKKEIPLVAHI